MATFKTVRVATGTKPPQYRSVNILTSGDTTFKTCTQTTLDDRTFETVYDAGASTVVGLGTLIIPGYSRGGVAPTVTSVTPSSGSLGGDSVVIAGTGFTGATAVKFGTTNAASFVVNSAIQITATSPTVAASTVDVTVTTPSGTSATSSVDHYTFAYVGPGDIMSGAVAWWGLRAYNAATAGTKAIRIQRSSDSTQKDINTVAATGMLNTSDAFFDGSATYTIEKIYDQSGALRGTGNTNLDLDVVTTAGATLVLNFSGALPAISAGGGKILTTNNFVVQTGAEPYTHSVVALRASGGQATICLQNNSNITESLFATAANQIGLYNGGSVQSVAAADGAPHALQCLFNGASSILYLDGSSHTVDDGGGGPLTPSSFGVFGSVAGNLTGNFWEAGWWETDHSAHFAAINANQRSAANGWNF